MRVLIVTPYYYPALVYGGPSFSVYYLAKGLAQRGVKVKVLTTNANGKNKLDIPPGKSIIVGGVATEYHPLSSFFSRRYFYSPSLKKAINRHIHNFDLVHIQGAFVYPALTAAKLAWLFSKSFIITPRGAWDPWSLKQKWFKKKVYFELLERRWINRAKAIHFTTQVERELAAKLNIKPSGYVVPNPVYLDSLHSKDDPFLFRKRWGIPLNARIVLFIGRIHPKKGVDLLLKAFAKVRRLLPEVRLLIVGPNEEGFGNRYKKTACSLSLAKDIVWTGLLSGSEKTACYYAADIFVLPSFQENFGMTAAEAMICGLPVLVSPGVNLATFINQHHSGEVVALDSKLWAIKIAEWLKDKARCKSAGNSGSQAAKAAFSITSVSKKMIKFYASILER